MSHYKTNLRDVFFNLFEFLEVDEYLGAAPWESLDREVAEDALREVDRMSREEFAASFVEGDRVPLTLADGEVALPEGIKASLAAYHEGEWHKFMLPQWIEGFGAPASLRWAVTELLVGANPSAYLYLSGGLMAAVIAAVGTPEQKERFAIPMVNGPWGGTMVLTEADAGSDVGAGTTKATQVEGDVYHLEGVKRFITSGDADYFENTIHCVLARPEGGGPGTKGLSMFIVPKYMVNEDGTLGERNGVYVTNLEDKMGIKASSTCEMTFGQDKPAVGYLVGGVHDGIRQMFMVIEEARMLIGAKSMATLSTGYLNALEFAKERVQGPDLTQARDPEAPRVAIIRHPDVRRMLMLQKAHAEGMRAIVYYTGWVQDQKERFSEDEYWGKLSDLLLPMVKGYSSEKAYEVLAQSLQVFGGSGFTKDYPIEQYIRDAKIDTLYEGTTGIQALDLFFRKIVKDQGATLTRLGSEIMETVKGGGADDPLARERDALGTALEDVQAHVGIMVGHAMASQEKPTELYKAGLLANHLLWSLSEVVVAWLLLRHAEVAQAALAGDPGADKEFYEGKVAAARFFARTGLRKVSMRLRWAEAEDGALMDLADEAF
ncbi:MAG: acyl-CoA dehydrogenase [Acidimicrobiia bacterium]|nr:acyl-CoA dehydrogenase [Acidimicrobiia bacterium]